MLSGISPWQLLILLAIVLAIFGTKKLRNIGGDLGSAMRDFRGAMREDDNERDDSAEPSKSEPDDDRVVDHQTASHTSQQASAHDSTRGDSETADRKS